MTTTAEDRPVAIENLGWALALVVAAQFVLQLDFSIVNVALPTIQQQLQFSPADLQWIVTGYALTFGSLLLFGGRLGDVVGRRTLLITGLVLFGVTSLSAGLAQSSLALIVSRFAQGASAAMVAPMALASVTDLYAEGPTRVRALGIFQGATAAGATTGIVLGGVLTQYVGWRAIFLVNPPIIAVLIFAMIRVLPRQGPQRNSPAPRHPGRRTGDGLYRQPDPRPERRPATRLRLPADSRRTDPRGRARCRICGGPTAFAGTHGAPQCDCRPDPTDCPHRHADHGCCRRRVRLLHLPVPPKGPPLQCNPHGLGTHSRHRDSHGRVDSAHQAASRPIRDQVAASRWVTLSEPASCGYPRST